MRRSAFILALLVSAAVSAAGPDRPSDRVAKDEAPDVSRAQPLARYPDAADLARLASVEGRPAPVALRVLGHPFSVTSRADGVQVWHYRWHAACCVWVKGGVCVKTFYTGGY